MTLSQAWFDLSPATSEVAPLLERFGARIDAPSTREALARCEREAVYPREVLDDLRDVGLHEIFAEPAVPSGPSTVTAPHLCGLNALTASRSGSLAIGLGIFSLSLLPIYVAGTPEQRRQVFDAIAAGGVPAMLLTEWAHGSDLLSNQARATPGRLDAEGRFVEHDAAPTCFRLVGEKQLINGGQEASLLMTLARSGDPVGDPDSAFGSMPPFTLCMARRDETVTALPRWRTLPAPASDISGVRFEGTLVPIEDVIGAPGQGFSVVQQVLTLSRGGIASLAAGAAWRAWELAWEHARERRLYGAPILALDPIADHLMDLGARAWLAAALAVKTSAFMNARGQAAAWFTAAGKLACCGLAEAAVDEGRRVLGARALVHEHPYAQVVRDVLLYGVFDGTSHVMRGHVEGMLARMRRGGEVGPSLEEVREVYATPSRPMVESAPRRRRPILLPLDAHAGALARLPGVDLSPIATLAEATLAMVEAARQGGAWAADAGVRFAFADLAAGLEAILALAELADAPRREALGMPPLRPDPLIAPLVAYTVCWYGARLAGQARRAAALAGLPHAEVDEAQRTCLDGFPAHRAALREALRG